MQYVKHFTQACFFKPEIYPTQASDPHILNIAFPYCGWLRQLPWKAFPVAAVEMLPTKLETAEVLALVLQRALVNSRRTMAAKLYQLFLPLQRTGAQ